MIQSTKLSLILEWIWPFTFQLAPSKSAAFIAVHPLKSDDKNACFQFKPMLLWSGARLCFTWFQEPGNIHQISLVVLPGDSHFRNQPQGLLICWVTTSWKLLSNPPLPVLRGTSQRGSWFGAPGPKTEVYSAWNKANTKWKLVYMLVKVPKA